MSIERTLAERAKLEQRQSESWRYSKCHNRELLRAKLNLLQQDGSTALIGWVRYCIAREHNGAEWRDCHQPDSAIRGRRWPKGLTEEEVLRICNHSGPEYWLESAFHVFTWQGKWTTLRAYTKESRLPPFLSDQARLCAPARRLARLLEAARKTGSWATAMRGAMAFQARLCAPARRLARLLEAARKTGSWATAMRGAMAFPPRPANPGLAKKRSVEAAEKHDWTASAELAGEVAVEQAETFGDDGGECEVPF